MNENRVRDELRRALGEPPGAAGTLWRLEGRLLELPGERRAARGWRRTAAVALAVGLAALAVATLVWPRVLTQLSELPGRTVPAGSMPPLPRGQATGPECRLPVIQTAAAPAGAGASRSVVVAGLVTVGDGRFVPDTGVAGTRAFPRYSTDDTWQPAWYDRSARRWVPVQPFAVAPDGLSYAYVVLSPLRPGKGPSPNESSTVHVYELRSQRDRIVWSQPGFVVVEDWLTDGLHVTASAPGGGVDTAWLLDPAGGGARSLPTSLMQDLAVAQRDTGATGASLSAVDGLGRPILLEGSRNPGARYTFFIEGGDGRRIVIYSGTMGDAEGFDPGLNFSADGDRLWAVNLDGSAIWLWTEKDGLKRFRLSVPHAAGRGPVSYQVAGPCL